MKHSYYLMLLIFTNTICFSQTTVVKSNHNCYSEKIKVKKTEKTFKDTVVLFCNYIKNADDKRIMCNNNNCNRNLAKIIYECKYISVYLKYQKHLNFFSIVSFKTDYHKVTIAHYYLCKRKTRKVEEMSRFKIFNGKITELNLDPDLIDKFITIDEYEKIGKDNSGEVL